MNDTTLDKQRWIMILSQGSQMLHTIPWNRKLRRLTRATELVECRSTRTMVLRSAMKYRANVLLGDCLSRCLLEKLFSLNS